jgi:hypothetical protein
MKINKENTAIEYLVHRKPEAVSAFFSQKDIEEIRLGDQRNIFHVIMASEKISGNLLELCSDSLRYLFQLPDDNGITPLMVMLNRDFAKVFVTYHKKWLDQFANLHVSADDDVTPLQYLVRHGKYLTPMYLHYLEQTTKKSLNRDTKLAGSPTILLQFILSNAPTRVLTKFLSTISEKFKPTDLQSFLDQALVTDEMSEEEGKTALELFAEKGDTNILNIIAQLGASVSSSRNIIQLALENKHLTCALHMMCSDAFKAASKVDFFVTALRQFFVDNETKKEETIVHGLKLVLEADTENRNRLLELIIRVPPQADTFVQGCSIFQLLCNAKKRLIIDYILDTFSDLFENTPFEEHPLDMMATVEPLHGNNVFHFLCTDSNLNMLVTATNDETLKANQTA